MNTLFIDTHSEKILLYLVLDRHIIKKEITSDKTHSENAIPLLKSLLDENNFKLNSLNQIVVINGPGSFTGVRIGVTIAKTIAFCLNIPIKTITSLEALGISSDAPFDIVTVKDSKGVYFAKKGNDKFIDFSYLNNSEFNGFIKGRNYKVLNSDQIDIIKVLEYLKNKEYTNPHKVNPVYIKGIDALK